MNRPQLHRARHALITAAALLSLSAAAADKSAAPAPAVTTAAGLSGCASFEELRKLEADKIAARQLKPLASEPTKPELRQELLAMMERDQKARTLASASAKARAVYAKFKGTWRPRLLPCCSQMIPLACTEPSAWVGKYQLARVLTPLSPEGMSSDDDPVRTPVTPLDSGGFT